MNQLVPVCRMFEKTKAFQRRPAAQGCIPGTHDRSACAGVNARTANIFLPGGICCRWGHVKTARLSAFCTSGGAAGAISVQTQYAF
jgi:hypothetical protein